MAKNQLCFVPRQLNSHDETWRRGFEPRKLSIFDVCKGEIVSIGFDFGN